LTIITGIAGCRCWLGHVAIAGSEGFIVIVAATIAIIGDYWLGWLSLVFMPNTLRWLPMNIGYSHFNSWSFILHHAAT